MKKPLISIYITNFNYEDYLETSIKSALNQNFPKDQYEVILIDDNSKDKSTDVIKKYLKKKKIKSYFK